MKRLGDILLHGAERFGDREALADPAESVSYRTLAEAASQLGRAMISLGVKPGDRSLVALPNSVNFARAHFANLLAGAVSVPCDANVTPTTLAEVSQCCEPRCLLTDAATFRRLGELAGMPGGIRHVLIFGLDSEAVSKLVPPVHSAETVMAAESAEFLEESRATPSELAALMFTTGATGRAKGVRLTHANVLAALNSIVEFVGYSADDREVVVLPLSHNFGLGHLYCNLMCGGAVYTENGLARVGRVLKAIESFRATGFPGTPMGFGMLMDNYGPVLASKGAKLRFSVINSAPMPPERTAQLQQLLPNLDIMVYYGLTEASRSAFCSLTRSGPSHYRSVGRPMKHVEVAVRSPGDDRAGEIVLRGPAVSDGYWGDREQTAASFRDGWLHTGDLGRIDENGFLWISGRIKDVINVGGYKVNPSEVERVIASAPGVTDVGVVGIDGLNRLAGESVVGAVVLKAGSPWDEPALVQYCVERLEKFKVPARFVSVTAIPRSDTGKIKRHELAAIAVAGLGVAAGN